MTVDECREAFESDCYCSKLDLAHDGTKYLRNEAYKLFNVWQDAWNTRAKPSLSDSARQMAVEILANLEHEQWMEWAKTIMISEAITMERKERWWKCIKHYSELSEKEKELDRIWAQKSLAALLEHFDLVER